LSIGPCVASRPLLNQLHSTTPNTPHTHTHPAQFSNHTGYPTIKGKAFDGEHLLELLQGLEANGLVRHTHLLTGYIGTLSLLEAIATVARTLRAANPGLTYGALMSGGVKAAASLCTALHSTTLHSNSP